MQPFSRDLWLALLFGLLFTGLFYYFVSSGLLRLQAFGWHTKTAANFAQLALPWCSWPLQRKQRKCLAQPILP